jgi:septal ring factor EnvC (AmiA/AmiB activator)
MPRQRSAQPRYRRRVVLELTPDESAVLDAQADLHGTIRGAVLAGLHELEADRSARLEAQLEALNEQLATAKREADAERERASAELTAQREGAAAGRQALKAAETKSKDRRADVRELKAELALATAARRASEQARLAAEALRVRHAYCAACDTLVPEAEWGEQTHGKGFATYHKKHEFRPKRGGMFGEAASILFWRSRAVGGNS